MLNQEVSSTIFKVSGITWPGIEPRSPGPLANTLPIWPNSQLSPTITLWVSCKGCHQIPSHEKNKQTHLLFESVFINMLIFQTGLSDLSFKTAFPKEIPDHIYPTPLLEQDMTQGQFLSRVYQVWIESFPSPRLVASLRLKKTSLLYYLPIAGGRIIGFIPFPRVLVLCEMQSVSSRIWTRLAVSISYDDNH